MPDRLLLVEDTAVAVDGLPVGAGPGRAPGGLRLQPGRGAGAAASRSGRTLVLLDLQLPDGDGLELLQTLRRDAPELAGHRDHRQRLDQPRGAGDARRRLRLPGQAVRRGAAAQRGAERARLGAASARRGGSRRRPRRRPASRASSAARRRWPRSTAWCARSAARPPPSSSPARAAPARRSAPAPSTPMSTRAAKPFVPLNCAAIPRDLLESEVFGHLKGAFTGALSDKPGAAAVADGGTLFLDEICEMDLSLQTKLLRFLQTSTIQPVGARAADPGRRAHRLRHQPRPGRGGARAAASARTSTTACTWCRSTCRRCAPGPRTSWTSRRRA